MDPLQDASVIKELFEVSFFRIRLRPGKSAFPGPGRDAGACQQEFLILSVCFFSIGNGCDNFDELAMTTYSP